jgi:hypothetical protein
LATKLIYLARELSLPSVAARLDGFYFHAFNELAPMERGRRRMLDRLTG